MSTTSKTITVRAARPSRALIDQLAAVSGRTAADIANALRGGETVRIRSADAAQVVQAIERNGGRAKVVDSHAPAPRG